MGTTLERRPMKSRFTEWLDMPDFFGMPDLVHFFDRDRLAEMMRVEETYHDDHLEIRAEMPGIDPDKDVEITMADGLLTIKAERREETKEEHEGRTRSEFRYGSFHRSLPVPKDAAMTDVVATYKDGILLIKVPLPKATEPTVTKVPVSRG